MHIAAEFPEKILSVKASSTYCLIKILLLNSFGTKSLTHFKDKLYIENTIYIRVIENSPDPL